jgi:hypothetical protein
VINVVLTCPFQLKVLLFHNQSYFTRRHKSLNMRTTTTSPGGDNGATTARDAGADTTTRRVKGTRRKTIEKAQRPKKKKTQKLPETWTASLAAFLVRNQISRLPLTPGGMGGMGGLPRLPRLPGLLDMTRTSRLPMASLAFGSARGLRGRLRGWGASRAC